MAMTCRFAVLPISAALALLAAAPATSLMAQTPPSERDLRIYAGLHAAAATGDIAAIEQLVADGEKPNVQDSKSRTPRMVANPNARDADGYDVLTVAAINHDVEMLKLALTGGANARVVVGRDDGSA